jgi:hypothetical protein
MKPEMVKCEVYKRGEDFVWLQNWGSPITPLNIMWPLLQSSVAEAITAYIESCNRELAMRERQAKEICENIATAKGLDV